MNLFWKRSAKFSSFRNSCKEILLESNPIQKLQQIKNLNEWANKYEGSSFLEPNEDDNEYWKTIDFRFPENIKFESVRNITEFCKVNKMPANVSMLHSICHIEFNAMSMYIDTIGRFLSVPEIQKEFILDFLRVANDEAEHFQMLYTRLQELGTCYGAIPVHNTLYENAEKTQHNLLSRIFITSLIAEARGMDSGPRLLTKLKSMQDKNSVLIMQKILDDEEKHVGFGIKWFKVFCEKEGINPKEKFRDLVHDLGAKVFPPFNKKARDRSGFDESWYINLD